MAYEITTPRLVEAANAAQAVIEGLLKGSLEPRRAREITAAAGKVISSVREDVNARSRAFQIHADEARLIEAAGAASGLATPPAPAALESANQTAADTSPASPATDVAAAGERPKNE